MLKNALYMNDHIHFLISHETLTFQIAGIPRELLARSSCKRSLLIVHGSCFRCCNPSHTNPKKTKKKNLVKNLELPSQIDIQSISNCKTQTEIQLQKA
jgi:hypothetical protein